MAIQALALLRLAPSQLADLKSLRVDPLEDAVVVHTGESFASEPAELSIALYQQLGDALAEHDDDRGIFFLPSVAAPQAKTYEGVIEEVGEGGMWAPAVDDEGDAEGGDFGALLGNLLNQMPSSLLTAATAAAQGQPGAMDTVSQQLTQLMSKSSEFTQLAAQMAQMLSQPGQGGNPNAAANLLDDVKNMAETFSKNGLDLSSPSLQELAEKVRTELEPPSEDAEKPKK